MFLPQLPKGARVVCGLVDWGGLEWRRKRLFSKLPDCWLKLGRRSSGPAGSFCPLSLSLSHFNNEKKGLVMLLALLLLLLCLGFLMYVCTLPAAVPVLTVYCTCVVRAAHYIS